jgi:uncharacterized membrane protein YgcG
MISSSTHSTQFIGWEKHKYWIVNLWRWLTGTRIPKYKVIETSTTSIYPFPERLAQIKSEIDANMAAKFIHRDTTIRHKPFPRSTTTVDPSSISHETTTKRPITYTKPTVGGDDDGRYDDYRRRKALDDEETIPFYIQEYPFTPSEAHNVSGGDDSHVSFGGGSGDGGGASGSWVDSTHDHGSSSYDSDSSSSSYDSGSSSDSSSSDSGSSDSGGGDCGGGD